MKKQKPLVVLVVLILSYALPATGAGSPNVEPIPNRYLAFGDSITYGGYAEQSYPQRLEAKLDLRVALSEVVNSGNPGEKTLGGSERIAGQVSEHRPLYVLIMEGTNDVTAEKPPDEVYANLLTMIDNARQNAGVDGVRIVLATLIPRLDYLNEATAAMNQQAVIPAAQARNVPLCDLWTAFLSHPYWEYLYRDDKHPNDAGLQLMADTFYDCLLASFPDFEEETTPPSAWIDLLPSSVECGQAVPVTWNGQDDLNWVADYDLQAQVGSSGEWTDWLLATTQTSGLHPGGGRYGQSLGYRVRARDLVGNQGDYSAPAYTPISDSAPPYETHVDPLPPVELAPVAVSWWGRDACADVTAYDVQYRVGSNGWADWLTATPDASDAFDPTSPQYGQTYSFRARAQDAAGNWGDWSETEAQTVLAQFGLGGQVYNLRHQPVAAAQVDVNPAPLRTDPRPGGFLAYLADGGDYDLTIARDDRYGPLPTMWDLAVNNHVSGLEFVLPPQDQAVADGGFEAGDLGAWQAGGSAPPTLTPTAHTGLGAVELGAAGQDSRLSQVVTPALTSTDPTLSFMVRLEAAGPASELGVELSNSGVLSSPVTFTLAVDSAAWSHAWFDLSALVGAPLTLTLSVSDSAALLVDEVSLGSALVGGYAVYLPLAWREQ